MNQPGQGPANGSFARAHDLDDLRAALADRGDVTFVVEYAGERWPVDVRTDLAVVLPRGALGYPR